MRGRERVLRLVDVAVTRDDSSSDAPIGFIGHAAVFNEPTVIRDWFGAFEEQVAAGAFRETIGADDIRMLLNHDPNFVLARNTAGSLWLSEDDKGLSVRADMAPTSYARDLAMLLERGDVSQMSFSFGVIDDRWEVLDDGTERRTLLNVKLYDVSPVTYPAYPTTDAGLRSLTIDGYASAEREARVRAREEEVRRYAERRHRMNALSQRLT